LFDAAFPNGDCAGAGLLLGVDRELPKDAGLLDGFVVPNGDGAGAWNPPELDENEFEIVLGLLPVAAKGEGVGAELPKGEDAILVFGWPTLPDEEEKGEGAGADPELPKLED